MMKTTFLCLWMMMAAVEAFVVVPCGRTTHMMVVQRATDNDDRLETAQKEWKEEAAMGHAVEESLDSDPDLDGMVSHKKQRNPRFVDKEAHRHDSLLAEIEHSLESDPDLSNVVADQLKKDHAAAVNQEFREKELHVHDSLLNEIEHAIDTDPDLSS